MSDMSDLTADRPSKMASDRNPAPANPAPRGPVSMVKPEKMASDRLQPPPPQRPAKKEGEVASVLPEGGS
jgi:hypothetical protein